MKFSQSMAMHLSGGGFSQLHYEVLADGKPTKITRHRVTNGRPEYLLTTDEFRCGDEVFDNLAAKGKGLIEWLEAHTEVAV